MIPIAPVNPKPTNENSCWNISKKYLESKKISRDQYPISLSMDHSICGNFASIFPTRSGPKSLISKFEKCCRSLTKISPEQVFLKISRIVHPTISGSIWEQFGKHPRINGEWVADRLEEYSDEVAQFGREINLDGPLQIKITMVTKPQ